MNSIVKAAAVGVALSLASIAIGRAQTQMQFPTTPWGGYAPGSIQCGELLGANLNVTTDQAIVISVPSGTWMVQDIVISNPSISLAAGSTAGDFYSAASKGGVTITNGSIAWTSLTTHAANTTGNAILATLSTAGNTTAFQGYAQTSKISQIYLSLTTGEGNAATADIRVRCRPLY